MLSLLLLLLLLVVLLLEVLANLLLEIAAQMLGIERCRRNLGGQGRTEFGALECLPAAGDLGRNKVGR